MTRRDEGEKGKKKNMVGLFAIPSQDVKGAKKGGLKEDGNGKKAT